MAAIFALCSITMIAPFLGLLFGIIEPVAVAPPLSFEIDSIKENFYFLITDVLKTHNELYGLILISAFFVIFSLLANTCRFLGMFFMANIRNGVVKDLRNDIYL